jgi:MFS family permease
MGRVDQGVRGRVVSTVSAISSAGQITAYLLGGALATVMDPRRIFLLAGSLGLIAPLLFGRSVIRSARPVNSEHSAPETPIAA